MKAMTTEEIIEFIRIFCTALRLSVIRAKLLELINYAESKHFTLLEFLYYILNEELDSRRQKRQVNGLKPAGMPCKVDLDAFQLIDGYGLDSWRLKVLRQLMWAREEKPSNLILIGKNGTGKTELALGLLTDALASSMRPFYTLFEDLGYVLKNMDVDPKCKKTYDYIVNKADILCIDSVRKCGYTAEVALAFEMLMNKIHERVAIIVTSTRPVSEWQDIFYDDTVTQSILERLIHRSETVTLKKTSHRLTHHEGFFDRLRKDVEGESAPEPSPDKESLLN